MKINLSEEQYHRLVEIVFAGTWLMNGNGTQKTAMAPYHEMVQHLYSYHAEFPSAHLIEYDEKYQEFYPSTAMEQIMFPFIDAYNKENFTEELIARMMQKVLGNCGSMPACEQVRLEEEFQREFRRYGVGRLEVCVEAERV